MAAILSLDDDPHVTHLVQLILEPEGYQVYRAEEGTEALGLVMENALDLIVLDLDMPGMDGATFLAAARSYGYSGAVLILSAHDPFDAKRLLNADAALGKPFEPDELVDYVAELVAT